MPPEALLQRLTVLSLNAEASAQHENWFEFGQLLEERNSVLERLTRFELTEHERQQISVIEQIDGRTMAVIHAQKRAVAEAMGTLARFRRITAKQLSDSFEQAA